MIRRLVSQCGWAVALSSVVLLGCGKSGSSTVAGPEPTHNGTPTPIVFTQASNLGYGLPNFWTSQDPRAFSATLRAHGLGLTIIELRPDALGGQEAPLAQTGAFLAAMRGQGITTLVHVVNWNCRACPTVAEVEQSVQRLATLGTSRVIVEVAEPDRADDPGKGIASLLAVRRAWPGSYALNWGHVPAIPSGLTWDVRDIHECRSDPSGWSTSPDVIHTTDCTASLTANAGGIAAWARRTGQRAILYDFQGRQPDLEVLAAMKKGLE